uniref:Caveolin n=1 Tax=Setaria digitata TaxID=48799 RepID=A0A915PQI9_9BILA
MLSTRSAEGHQMDRLALRCPLRSDHMGGHSRSNSQLLGGLRERSPAMCDRKEEIPAEKIPLKCDTDPEKLQVEGNSTKGKNDEVGKKEPKKMCRIWQQKSPRSYSFEREKDGTRKSRMTIGLDFENRDDKGINNHIIMDFCEIFAEPDGSHSFNWTWLATNRIFTATSVAIYKLLAAFIAIPFAVFFGILFAIVAVISVFLCTPLGILLGIPLNAFSKAKVTLPQKDWLRLSLFESPFHMGYHGSF